MIFEPCLYGICQIYSFPAKVNPWKASGAFKVLDDISIATSITDLRDTEKPDQFLFCHDGGVGAEFTLWAR
jgi:hypothetical protein